MDLNGYVSGGYFLALPAKRDEWFSAERVPERFVTLSRCLTAIAPGAWAIEWSPIDPESRLGDAAPFGIDGKGLKDVIAWSTAALDEGRLLWPNVFRDVDVAREFAGRFLGRSRDAMVLGIGLPRDGVEGFCQDAARAAREMNSVEAGIPELLGAGRELAGDGKRLGHDILGYDLGNFHSFLCNRLDEAFEQELGVTLNGSGLVDDLEQAWECADLAADPSIGAEPGLWYPWVVVRY